jgi:ABC-type transporter Mla MlaB component
MLRITTTYRLAETGARYTLRLAGRLEGDWAQELRRAWRALQNAVAAVPIRIELADVEHVDAPGRALLAEMRRAGVEILAGKNLGAAANRDDRIAAERRTDHEATKTQVEDPTGSRHGGIRGAARAAPRRRGRGAGKTSSYLPVAIGEGFPTITARMKAAKPVVETRQADLLAERHDPSNRPAQGVMMSRGKALQGRRRP